jgi:glutathione S-transferase
MITLYHAPFTRSHLIRFALEEAGLPHEIVRLDVTKGQHKAPEYVRVSPLGQLPALKDGDLTICESAAICLYLGDKVGTTLAPPIGTPERAAYYHWVVFAVATQLIALSKIALHTRFLPEAMRSAAVAEDGRRHWAEVAPVLTGAVKGKRFLLGDAFTMADVMVGGSLWLANLIGVLEPHAELLAYHRRVADRPAFQKAFGDAKAP